MVGSVRVSILIDELEFCDAGLIIGQGVVEYDGAGILHVSSVVCIFVLTQVAADIWRNCTSAREREPFRVHRESYVELRLVDTESGIRLEGLLDDSAPSMVPSLGISSVDEVVRHQIPKVDGIVETLDGLGHLVCNHVHGLGRRRNGEKGGLAGRATVRIELLANFFC